MTEFRYEIFTKIPRNFDPEIEGATIDSIIESCDNVKRHSVPNILGNTRIIIDTKRELSNEDRNYLRDQLKEEFENPYFRIHQIKEGQSDSCGNRNLPD